MDGSFLKIQEAARQSQAVKKEGSHIRLMNVVGNQAVIQRVRKAYAGEKINELLPMDLAFESQGCDVVFDASCKHGSNWISKAIPMKSWSGSEGGHLTFAVHLNITFKGGFYNDTDHTLNVDIKNIHWTIRSAEDQTRIDRAGTATVDAPYAFHKSSGGWNTGDKAEDSTAETIVRIGGDPRETAMRHIDIEVTKADLGRSIIRECNTAYAGSIVTVTF